MRKSHITRREFLILSGAVTAASLITVSCDGGAESGGSTTAYKLSLRGRRGSNAAKNHNANFLFATIEAADKNRAHPGDNSRIVPVLINRARFDQLFNNGNTAVADLRNF
jgi:hypothetical protein